MPLGGMKVLQKSRNRMLSFLHLEVKTKSHKSLERRKTRKTKRSMIMIINISISLRNKLTMKIWTIKFRMKLYLLMSWHHILKLLQSSMIIFTIIKMKGTRVSIIITIIVMIHSIKMIMITIMAIAIKIIMITIKIIVTITKIIINIIMVINIKMIKSQP